MRKKFWVLTLLLVVGLLIQACAPKLSPQQPCSFVMSADQQRVSWGSETPAKLYVDSSVPTEFYDSIRAAVDQWNTSMGYPVLQLVGWTTAYPAERQDGANIIYFNKAWPTDAANAEKQAVTTIYWAADRIFEADIRINGAGQFQYFAGPTSVAGRVDFQSLILHELGHVLGLEHNETPGTVMAKRLENGTLRRKPSPVDVSDLKCEY